MPWSKARARSATDPVAAVKRSYEAAITDEFIEPVTIVDSRHEPVGRIRAEDACIFFNYRADRGREMTQALTEAPLKLHFTTMTQYDKALPVPFVLPREHPNNILANVMAAHNWKNLRVAETEKYAHVTYFFNGGNEKPYPGEEREMVPSPKVATYDLKPEMNAEGVTETVVKAHRDARFRRDRDELRQRGHGGAFGKIRTDGAGGGSGRRGPREDLRRRCSEKAAAGSSRRIMATPR